MLLHITCEFLKVNWLFSLFLQMNTHLTQRPILLTRHGESQDNVRGRIGGDTALRYMLMFVFGLYLTHAYPFVVSHKRTGRILKLFLYCESYWDFISLLACACTSCTTHILEWLCGYLDCMEFGSNNTHTHTHTQTHLAQWTFLTLSLFRLPSSLSFSFLTLKYSGPVLPFSKPSPSPSFYPPFLFESLPWSHLKPSIWWWDVLPLLHSS